MTTSKAKDRAEELVNKALNKAMQDFDGTGRTVDSLRNLVLKRLIGADGGAGYPLALQHAAMKSYIGDMVAKNLRSTLPLSVAKALGNSAPPDIRFAFDKIPAWIALSSGRNAEWVPSIKAAPEHWEANFIMKRRLAERSMQKSNDPRDMSEFLKSYGLGSLEDLIEPAKKSSKKRRA